MTTQQSTSRYDWQAFDGKSMSTFPYINPLELQSNDDFFVKLRYGQRIDNLSYQYLGNGHYWWVICLLNGLKTPFDKALITGAIIRVPISVANFFKILEEKNIQTT